MKLFRYKARDKDDEVVEGALEASNEKEAVQILRGKNLLIIKLVVDSGDTLASFFASFQKPKLDEMANFTRQFATMIGSGLSLVESLRVLRDQSKPAMALVIEKVAGEIEAGSTLAGAMEKSEGGFSSVYIALVRVGEAAGILDKILVKLAETLEAEQDFRSKTKGALVYPAIVVSGMIVVTTIMMIFVIPKMTDMYTDMGIDLPMITQILVGVSSFMVHFWWLLLVVFGGAVVFFKRWSKTEMGGLIVEQAKFKIPIWGALQKDIIMAKFARTMGLLAGAGISILEALEIVSSTLGSIIFAEGLKRAASRVEKGESLADSLSVVSEFPPILSQMVAVGEQTGKVDEVLTRLAIFYESESAQKIKALTTAIEPLIMIVMGVGVGFLVAAVIMPIYHLTSQF